MEKIAIIAGKGKLPLYWAQKAREKDYELYAFPVVENTVSLSKYVIQTFRINIASLNKLIKLLLKHKIKKVIMLGKVEKCNLFNDFKPDFEMEQLLDGLDNFKDDSILKAIVEKLEDYGIEVLPQSTFLEPLLVNSGILTTAQDQVEPEILADMKFGIKIAREIGRLDIGQTVIVKNRAVMAVEAIEGTDATILRGGKLGQGKITMAKVSKPQQDFRFDIPTIGLETLNNLIKVKAQGLVMEAGKSFLLDKEKFLKKAKKAGITVMGWK